nr:MAG TPA: hypothetical protein [Caudoviricetes sp.]
MSIEISLFYQFFIDTVRLRMYYVSVEVIV